MAIHESEWARLCMAIFVVLIFLLPTTSVKLNRNIRNLRYPLPPGPPGLPFVGNAFQLRNAHWLTFSAWRKIYGMYILRFEIYYPTLTQTVV